MNCDLARIVFNTAQGPPNDVMFLSITHVQKFLGEKDTHPQGDMSDERALRLAAQGPFKEN